jgi:hypothetical protein
MERARTELEASVAGRDVPAVSAVAALLRELAEADLVALRLAAQVLGHKAGLHDRPAVVSWFADLGHAVDFEMARRGVGFVLGQPPEPNLPADADEHDRGLLVEHLGLLSDNGQLSAAVRAFCSALRASLG